MNNSKITALALLSTMLLLFRGVIPTQMNAAEGASGSVLSQHDLIRRYCELEQVIRTQKEILQSLEDKKTLAVPFRVKGDLGVPQIAPVPKDEIWSRSLHLVDRRRFLESWSWLMGTQSDGTLKYADSVKTLGQYQRFYKKALEEDISQNEADMLAIKSELFKTGGIPSKPFAANAAAQQALDLINTILDAAAQPAPPGAKSLAITEVSATPTEVETGQQVRVQAVYWAKELGSPSLKIEEKIILTGPKGTPQVLTSQREFSEKQHSTKPALMDGACRPVFEITPGTAGQYTFQLEIRIAGVAQPVTRDVKFTAKPKPRSVDRGTTAASSGKPVWRLVKAEPNRKATDGVRPHFEHDGGWKDDTDMRVTLTTGYLEMKRTHPKGEVTSHSIGTGNLTPPPNEIAPGQIFECPVTATFKIPRYGDGVTKEYGVELRSDTRINITYVPGGASTRSSWCLANKDRPSVSGVCRFTVPADLPEQFSIWANVSHPQGMATTGWWTYKKQPAGSSQATQSQTGEGASHDAGGITQVKDLTPAVLAQPCNLKAWLMKDTITLMPGEVSQIDGVFVSGWRGNTEDRVEVVINVQDGFGSLAANRNIVVAPGPTSAHPPEMHNAGVQDSGDRYYFSELWSARSTAPPSTNVVPIIVRQKGCPPVTLSLTVVVLPKGGKGGDALPADGLSTALNAGLQIGTAANAAFHERFNRRDLRQLTSASLTAARGAAAALPAAARTDLTALDRLIRDLAKTSDREAYDQINQLRVDLLNGMARQTVAIPLSGGSFNLARIGEIGVYLGWIVAGAHYYGDAPPQPDMVNFIRATAGEMRTRTETINQQLGQVWLDPKLIDEILRATDNGGTGSQIRAAAHAAFSGMYRAAATLGTRGLTLGPAGARTGDVGVTR